MGDYSGLLERLQEEFGTEELTKTNILEYITEVSRKTNSKERLANEIAVSFSIARFQKFAESKGIQLGEKARAGEEKWGKKDVLVIRDAKGRFKAWKKE